ncbi:MAG: DUF3857 domain-containing protein [Phycisphaerae bacterium]
MKTRALAAQRNCIVASFMASMMLFCPGAIAADFTRVSRDQYPKADAVVLSLSQTYTRHDDGSLTYEEHRFVQLLDNRAWRRHADPRIPFVSGKQTIELMAARAHLPSGDVLDLPDYSRHEVSPNLAKWPAFADQREMVFTQSGIQNGAVMEFHVRRTSKPGFRRWLEADISLGGQDPIVRREINVVRPESSRELRIHWFRPEPRISGLFDGDQPELKISRNEARATTKTWIIENIPGFMEEPQGLPWPERRGRLQFTERPSGESWVQDTIQRIESAAKLDGDIRSFVDEATKDATATSERLDSLFGAIKENIAWVKDDLAWRDHQLRPASVVLQTRYGSTLEMEALALAATRALGENAEPYLAADAFTARPDLLTDADLADVYLAVGQTNERTWYHPYDGLADLQGRFRKRMRFGASGNQLADELQRGNRMDVDSISIRGRASLDEQLTTLTGSLDVDLRHGFINTVHARDAKKRRALLQRAIRHILPNAKVTNDDVALLTDTHMRATLDFEVEKPLQHVGDARMLMLGESDPAIHQSGIQHDLPSRRTPLRLFAPVASQLDLTLELPANVAIEALPEACDVSTISGNVIEQRISLNGTNVRIIRDIKFDKMEPSEYFRMRRGMRQLMNPVSRTVLLMSERSGSND